MRVTGLAACKLIASFSKRFSPLLRLWCIDKNHSIPANRDFGPLKNAPSVQQSQLLSWWASTCYFPSRLAPQLARDQKQPRRDGDDPDSSRDALTGGGDALLA